MNRVSSGYHTVHICEFSFSRICMCTFADFEEKKHGVSTYYGVPFVVGVPRFSRWFLLSCQFCCGCYSYTSVVYHGDTAVAIESLMLLPSILLLTSLCYWCSHSQRAWRLCCVYTNLLNKQNLLRFDLSKMLNKQGSLCFENGKFSLCP